jgi:tRNA (mo5U34)-methyltransferase
VGAPVGDDKFRAVRERVWFYDFELPDGTHTRCDVPESIRPVHENRRRYLETAIRQHVPNAQDLTAVDLASHEGYFSIELAKHFSFVRGFEIRPESLAAAQQISGALAVTNVEFTPADLQNMEFDERLQADFVLMYGLLYHLENPIRVLRLASQLSRRHILVETQLFPYDVTGRIEDGSYLSQRAVEGVFALAPDYPLGREGGSTEVALVPSLNALLFLLRTFGFTNLEVIGPDPDDYEQFRRGSRAVVYGSKAN